MQHSHSFKTLNFTRIKALQTLKPGDWKTLNFQPCPTQLCTFVCKLLFQIHNLNYLFLWHLEKSSVLLWIRLELLLRISEKFIRCWPFSHESEHTIVWKSFLCLPVRSAKAVLNSHFKSLVNDFTVKSFDFLLEQCSGVIGSWPAWVQTLISNLNSAAWPTSCEGLISP